MSQQPSNADEIAYWNGDAGARWVEAQERLDAMLEPATAELIAAAHVAPGERVLDIGCGCGDTAIRLAAMGARVTGIDVSAPMLARARQRAPAVEFIQADASTQRFERGFDVLFSRFGVMFFADPDAAFAHLRRALRPAGRLAFLCWRDWRDNEWVRVPITAVRPHLPPQPQSGPEEPGPFAFADPARVRRILTAGGFAGIAMRPFDADLVLGATLDEAVDHLRAFGPVARALADATDTEKTAAVAALRGALQPCAARRPFTLSGAMWIVNAQI